MKRETQIKEIKRILDEYCEGSITTSELEVSNSPCLSSNGNGTLNVSKLVETISIDDVEVVTYNGETEIDTDYLDYEDEDLSDDIIDEIYNLLEQHEVDCEKALKRSQN